jgi:hypothetical protein
MLTDIKTTVIRLIHNRIQTLNFMIFELFALIKFKTPRSDLPTTPSLIREHKPVEGPYSHHFLRSER